MPQLLSTDNFPKAKGVDIIVVAVTFKKIISRLDALSTVSKIDLIVAKTTLG